MASASSGARSGLTYARSPARATSEVDDIDLSLLRELVADARVSQRGLGRRVGLSPPSVRERVTRLERLGVIRGYRAEIDFGALGSPLVVYLGIAAVQGLDQRKLIERLGAMPEVESVDVITGRLDLMLRLRVRDHAHLREALFERIWQQPGVNRTETFICIDTMPHKNFGGQFIAALLHQPAPHLRDVEGG